MLNPAALRRTCRTTVWGVSVIGVVLAGVAGCTSGPSAQTVPMSPSRSATSAPPLTSPSSTASPADAAAQAALAAYLGMWHEMAAAGATSDWHDPKLGQYATGDALLVISKSLYTDHLNGQVTKGTPTNTPWVSSAQPPTDPTTVMISDCGDDSHWLKYTTNGQLADNIPGGRRSITAEVRKQPHGQWLVTRFAVEATRTC